MTSAMPAAPVWERHFHDRVTHGHWSLTAEDVDEEPLDRDVRDEVMIGEGTVYLMCHPVFDDVDLVIQCYEAPPGLPGPPWSEVDAFEGVVAVPLMEESQGLTVYDSIEPLDDGEVAPCGPGKHVVRARRLPVEDPPETEGMDRTIRWLVQLFPEPE